MTAYLFALFCVSNLGARYQVLGSLFWLLVLPAIMVSMLVKRLFAFEGVGVVGGVGRVVAG